MTYPGLRRRRAAAPQPAPATTRTLSPRSAVRAPTMSAPAVDDAANPQFAQQAAHLIPAEVRLIAGCHTEQTSADVANVLQTSNLPSPAGKAGGACTSALLDILHQHQMRSSQVPSQQHYHNSAPSSQQLTFQQLLLALRSKLASQGFDQIPQLTSSRPLDVAATPFDLGGHADGATKRAVLIGINYRGQDGQLRGCHNDVYNMQQYLIQAQGFAPKNILLLVDDGRHHAPTRQTIIHALRELVRQSVHGDAVFVAYSGHGGLLWPEFNLFKQKQSSSSSNSNKQYDETLYPLDHERAGQIRDFNLYRHFVQPMSAGVTVTALFDCCHSGTVLDLPYAFQPTHGGLIRMERSMDALANVGMLYLLMGGMFPPEGFGDVTSHIENTTGGTIEDYQGLGLSSEEDAGWDDRGGDETAAPDDGDFPTDDPGDGDYGGYADMPPDAGGDDWGGGDNNDFGAGDDWGGDDWGGATTDGAADLFSGNVDDGDDGGGIDCGCVADVLSNILSGGNDDD